MVELKPARVFEQFAKINQIPRPSKHEEQMIEYLKKFGADRGLEVKVDKTGNVIICKPATKGFENRATTILILRKTLFKPMLKANGFMPREQL